MYTYLYTMGACNTTYSHYVHCSRSPADASGVGVQYFVGPIRHKRGSGEPIQVPGKWKSIEASSPTLEDRR